MLKEIIYAIIFRFQPNGEQILAIFLVFFWTYPTGGIHELYVFLRNSVLVYLIRTRKEVGIHTNPIYLKLWLGSIFFNKA